MAGLLRNTAAKTKGGGTYLIGKQIQRNTSTGAFEAFVGTDCLGQTAGTWHQFGSLESMDIPRDDKGVHTLTPTMVEWDTDRRNLMINIAPYTASAATKKEALELEDGTVLEATDASGEDTSLPYWLLIYRGAPTAAAKEVVFFCVAQAKRSGGPGAAGSGKYNKQKISFTTIDAGGFVTTKPSSGDTWLTNVTVPTLSGVKAHGIWVEGT